MIEVDLLFWTTFNCILLLIYHRCIRFIIDYFFRHFLSNPNGESISKWPPYDANSKQYIILDEPIRTGENLKSGATALLSRILENGRRRLIRDEL